MASRRVSRRAWRRLSIEPGSGILWPVFAARNFKFAFGVNIFSRCGRRRVHHDVAISLPNTLLAGRWLSDGMAGAARHLTESAPAEKKRRNEDE